MATTSSGTPTAGTKVSGIDVLVAEDRRIQAKILLRRLTEAGHAVRWAKNGAIVAHGRDGRAVS